MVVMILIVLGLGMMPSMMSSGGRQDPPGHSGFGSDYLSGKSKGTCVIYLARHADVAGIAVPPLFTTLRLQCPLEVNI